MGSQKNDGLGNNRVTMASRMAIDHEVVGGESSTEKRGRKRDGAEEGKKRHDSFFFGKNTACMLVELMWRATCAKSVECVGL